MTLVIDIFVTITNMFAFDFIVKAFIVGVLISLCAALLGVSLVLKRYAMIGDGLSHVAFGALAVGVAFGATPMYVAVPVSIVAAFLLLRISENSKIKGDAAIALISTSSLAIGVTAISMRRGTNIDLNSYLFGSILAVTIEDMWMVVGLATLVILFFVIFYNKIVAITFDEQFATAVGTPTGFYNMIVAFFTAITIVLGMRLMGALLISSLLIFPVLSAMRVCKSFFTVVVCAAVISVCCFVVGLVVSFSLGTPTGTSIVLTHLAIFLLFLLAKFKSGI